MAREAGVYSGANEMVFAASLERFAVLVAEHERERIKQANAPEIEKINAHIKALENAVAAEREACAKLVENYCGAWDDEGYALASSIRARGKNE